MIDPNPIICKTFDEVWNGLFADIYQQHYGDRTRWDYFIAQVESVMKFEESCNRDIKILDVASGGCCEPAITLSKKGYNVFATDGYEKMFNNAVEWAAKKKAQINFSDRLVKYHELRNYYSDESFDALFCAGNAFCHVPPEEVDNTLDTMASLIKLGGYFVLDVKKYTEAGVEIECNKETMKPQERGLREKLVRYRAGDEIIVRMESDFDYHKDLKAIYNIRFYFSSGKCGKIFLTFWRYTAQDLKEKLETRGLRSTILSPDVCKWHFDILVAEKV